jgi:hypothetical protein
MSRATSFVAARIGHGFTVPYLGLPCLRRHLTRCSPHRHGVEHSFSFGSSPAVQPSDFTANYYNLG